MASSEEAPHGWVQRPNASNFSVTLLVFSWALLPVGFMVMFLIFNRYPEHRFPLSMATFGMLVLTFITGVGQRQSALRDGRVLLCATMLATTAVTVVGLRVLELDEYWWVSFACVLGCVPMLFVAMSHLSACTAPGLERPWPANVAVPVDCLPGWRVVSATWTQGEMAWSNQHGAVSVLYGAMDDDRPVLRMEAFAHGASLPLTDFGDVDWQRWASAVQADGEEE